MSNKNNEQYFEEVAQNSGNTPDLIDGMDPGLAMWLYEEKKEITNNFAELPEGYEKPEDLLVNGMDPGLAAFLINERNQRAEFSTKDYDQQPTDDFSFEP